MPSIKKLSHQVAPLFSLLNLSKFSFVRVSRYQLQVYRSHKPLCQFSDSSLSNLNMQTNLLEFHHKFTLPLQPFSTMADRILVQARDPAKLCMELQNAIHEHRLSDAWKLQEQHMQMEGFPRKSIVNRLLTSFAESQDFIWLEKAHGLVEQAFEESKQNLLEKQTLIYLAFSLASCGFPVPASTVLRKLLSMEQFPPVTAWSAILAHMSRM